MPGGCRLESKTFSDIPEAHTSDPRKQRVPEIPEGLNVLEIDPELQKLPPYGPRVEDKTFSDIPEAHSV